MILTSTKMAFFDAVHQRFRTNDYRHCPRFILMREERIEHGEYSPVIDAVYDATVHAADEIYSPIKWSNGDLVIPCSAEQTPSLARVVISPSQSQSIREGKAMSEDILICGLYAEIAQKVNGGDKVVHLHYVQPRNLIQHHRVLPVMYRPFFCMVSNGNVLCNMNQTMLPVRLAQDGLTRIQQYATNRKLPAERPLPLALKGQDVKSCCDYCPFSGMCKTMDKQKVYTLEQVRGLNPAPKERS